MLEIIKWRLRLVAGCTLFALATCILLPILMICGDPFHDGDQTGELGDRLAGKALD